MVMNFIVFLLLDLVGLMIYFRNPKRFFFYCISVQPYVMPFICLPLQYWLDSDTIISINVGYSRALCMLMLMITIVSISQKKECLKGFKFLFVSCFLLISFFILKNLSVGFHFGALSMNIKEALYMLAPFILLAIDKRVVPDRKSFVVYIEWFVWIQVFFCFLNLFGFRLYGNIHDDSFDDSLICGTFTRYNHMANYLATFFFVLSNEYYKYKRISIKKYYILSSLIGLLIVFSGSRMTFVLYAFSIFYYVIIYYRKSIIGVLCVIVVLIASWKLIAGNQDYYGMNQNDGEGLERTISGIVNVANSDDLSQGSTIALSVLLLESFFDSPLTGNGMSKRGSDFYYFSENASEKNFPTDARLVYMLVEHGIIGVLLYAFFFLSILKYTKFMGQEHERSFFLGALLFFVLFTITDDGIFDRIQLLIFVTYSFSYINNRYILKTELQ